MTIKSHLGLEPTAIGENLFTPSLTATKAMQKAVAGYKPHDFGGRYKGDKKVLVLLTEADTLTMDNGTMFRTGNHPVETFVPLLHLESVGIDYDFATPTGAAGKVEYWALPPDDKAIGDIMTRTAPDRNTPLTFAGAIDRMLAGDYFAVFIPGGHGAVVGLPDDPNMGVILNHFIESDQHVISLCHGPAAFLAAKNSDGRSTFEDYEINAFPDSTDRLLPATGYLPAQMPWFFGARLEEAGVKIVNKLMLGFTHQDRKVITGDGPLAANALGHDMAEALVNL